MNEQLLQIERMRKRVLWRRILLIIIPIVVLTGAFFILGVEAIVLFAVFVFLAIAIDFGVYLIFIRKKESNHKKFRIFAIQLRDSHDSYGHSDCAVSA